MLRVKFLTSLSFVTVLIWVTASLAESKSSRYLEELLHYEAQLLQQGASKVQSPSPAFGSNPFLIITIPHTQQKIVLLRGSSEVLLLDPSLKIVDRKPTPRLPRGWVLVDDRHLFVTGELSNAVILYEVGPGELLEKTKFSIEQSTGLRGAAYVPELNSLFVIDAPRRKLIQVSLSPKWRDGNTALRTKEYPIGAGALQIEYAHGHLFLNQLLNHRIDVIPLTTNGADLSNQQSIVHNGPIWGFNTASRGDHLLLAAVGVEDHPLDRTQGEFGYVDSFLFLYEVPVARPKGSGSPRRLAARNLSAHNIVTPKAVRLEHDATGFKVWVLAFGSDRGAVFNLQGPKLSPARTFPAPPGSTDFLVEQTKTGTQLLATNTLLDQVYRLTPAGPPDAQGILEKVSLANLYPSSEARAGELLFFTTLFSPKNRTEGHLSRFTCETCHFEGTIDGRIHYTGRGNVFATTKTLRGLANNVPLFSRAGDQSLASMVIAEFQVANQKRQDDFSLAVDQYPWLKNIQELPPRLGALELRKSFLAFFVHFGNETNPRTAITTQLTPAAVAGLEVFRTRCAYCHRAIRSTRHEEIVNFQDWQASIEDPSIDLVWGAPFYTKTNILPYVSQKGARVPSLRRVSEKYPYFTNGSSRDLHSVLERFRYRGATVWHHYEGPDSIELQSLNPKEIDQLEELLRYF